MAFENRKIVVVSDSIRQVDVHRRRRLRERIIVLLMNREYENGSVAAKNRGRAIAMMHVRVQDHRGLNRSVELQPPYRYCHIVNHTKTLAVIGIGVMKTPADIRGPAVDQRVPRGKDRPSSRHPAPLDYLSEIGNRHPQ